MKFDISSLDRNKIIDNIPVWSIVTLSVFIFGFIGFYTYCGSNNIPLVIPELQLIIGIGIYTLLFIISLFVVQSSMWNSKSDKALVIMGLFKFLLNTPVSIAIISTILILFYSRGYWENAWGIKKLKDKEEEPEEVKKTGSLILEIFGHLAAGAIWYFYDKQFYWQFFTVFILLHEANRIVLEKKVAYMSLILGIIIVPIFVSYNFLKNADCTIVGLNTSNVTLLMEDNTLKTGFMILRDGNDIYFKAYINSDTTFIIDRDDVKEVRVLKYNNKIKQFINANPTNDQNNASNNKVDSSSNVLDTTNRKK